MSRLKNISIEFMQLSSQQNAREFLNDEKIFQV